MTGPLAKHRVKAKADEQGNEGENDDCGQRSGPFL
jgi:hypothetical protein